MITTTGPEMVCVDVDADDTADNFQVCDTEAFGENPNVPALRYWSAALRDVHRNTLELIDEFPDVRTDNVATWAVDPADWNSALIDTW